MKALDERGLFDVVRELATTVESHGIALYACAAEHAAKAQGGADYVRELRHLAQGISAELAHQVGLSVKADSHDPVSIEGDAYELRLFAEALALVGSELDQMAGAALGAAQEGGTT